MGTSSKPHTTHTTGLCPATGILRDGWGVRGIVRDLVHRAAWHLPRPFGAFHRGSGGTRGRSAARPCRRRPAGAGWPELTRLATLVALSLFGLLVPPLLGSLAHAGELIQNGSFETGTFGSYWVHGAYLKNRQGSSYADHVVLPDLPYSGNYSALLGFKYTAPQTSAGGYMYQQVAIPSNISRATLFFKVRMQGYDSTPYDPFVAQIRRTNDSIWQTILTLTFPEYNYIFKDSGWLDDNNSLPVGYDMTGFAGNTVRVYFDQANTIDALYQTWSLVDDVSLVYKKFVDLAVDGNGNDVFGNTGTGLGGSSDRSGLPGDTLVFDLNVENEGLTSDSYVLSRTAPSGWTVLLNTGVSLVGFPFSTGAIAAGDVRHWKVIVVPPVGAPSGVQNVIVNALSTSFSNRYDSVRLGVNVLQAHYGTDLVVEGNGFGVIGENGGGGFALKVAPWDSTVSYPIELLNTGDVPAVYRVAFTADAGVAATLWYQGVSRTAPFNTQSIPADGSAVMSLTVTVPNPRPGGDYATIVRAAAVTDTLKKDSIRALVRLRAPKVDLVIGANGNGIYDGTFSGLGGSSSNAGERGTSVYFPLLVENESALADSFTLSWTSPGTGWSARLLEGGVERTFPFNTPSMSPNSLLEYVVKISIPSGASFSTYTSRVHAVSRRDNRVSESVTAAVSVTEAGQLDMLIDGSGGGVYGPVGTGLGGSSTRTIAPGDSAVFSVELRNLSGTNSIDVYWTTPAGWRVTFDGRSSPVNGHPAGVYAFKVVVPASTPAGTVSIIVDARKSDKPFYMDSIIGRVTVYRPRAVDAVIDGKGNGLYGPLGSGWGGTSSQTHSAPATLKFTVELQNEGAEDDRYTVAWNQIPLWQAKYGGSASPYVTGVVPAGSFSLHTFEVNVPPNAIPGNYVYIIDIVSNADHHVVESIEARVSIVGPPQVDLVIDGNGAGVFGTIGSGEGGFSVRAFPPGGAYAAALEIRNVGSFADSFYVFWGPPAGWPVGSVVLNDGTNDLTSPLWTPLIGAGSTRIYTVKVQVPADAGVGTFPAVINSHSSLPPNAAESVRLVSLTAGVVMGTVFDDRDHNAIFGPQDVGLGGVTVVETATGLTVVTGGDGRYVFLLPAGVSSTVVERNLSGFVSLSPDTVGPAVLAAGDTLVVDFADVPGIRLSTGVVANGVPGGFVDFPHRLDAGTKGPVVLTAVADPLAVTALFLDVNENGLFDAGDRVLEPADLDMDPPAGKDHVYVIVRLYIPMPSSTGATYRVVVDAVQTIEGTVLTSRARVFDAAIVIDGGAGILALTKSVDTGAAAPGSILTYTISFTNTGLDSVQNILVLDPVSVHVDPVADAFGPGMDVEWRKDASTVVYLTLDPADSDECAYNGAERLLRLTFSRNAPYLLKPGDGGALSYKVIVK